MQAGGQQDRKYTGHCNHKKIQEILKEHGPSLQEHEQLALEKLRIGMHKIVGEIQNLEVTFYLGKFQDPITVLNGSGENKLIMEFLEDGEVKYEWVAKSLKEITKTFVGDLAKRMANVAFEILVNVTSQLFNKSIISAGYHAIAWKE